MSNATIRRSVVGSLGVVALAVMVWSPVAQAGPGPTPTATPTATPSPGGGGSVLILGPTVWGGLSSDEATNAIALGFGVDVVTAEEWGAMTAANFASYRALILGDTCSTTTAPIAAAEANRAVWSSVTSGNIVLIGSDPSYHDDEGGSALNNRGINFAASGDGTGLFATLSCYYYSAAPMTPVPLLDQYGSFTVTGSPRHDDDVHIVAESPALEGLTDADLSNWGASIHEVFDSFPPTFIPLAIAQGELGTGSLTFPDGSFGIPYILSRGAPPVTPTPTATPTATPTTGTPTIVELSPIDQGWYISHGRHGASNPNYVVMQINANEYRNFFVFDLSGIAPDIKSAVLQLYTWGISGNATYELRDYSNSQQDISELMQDHGEGSAEGIAIFGDLGTGLTYGSIGLDSFDARSTITISLNHTAIENMMSTNGLFVLGGKHLGLSSGECFFCASDTHPDNKLILNIDPTATPTPTASPTSTSTPTATPTASPTATSTATATPTATPTATSTATPTASPTATTPPADCRCVPTSVAPGGNLATLKNVATGGKGSRAYRNLTVKLEAQDVTHGSCPRGATSDPVAVSLRIEDDDGDVIIDQSKSGFVCVGQQPVFAKFWVSYEGPKHCKGSAVPTGNSPSHGDLFVTVATEDGSLIPTRGIVCKR